MRNGIKGQRTEKLELKMLSWNEPSCFSSFEKDQVVFVELGPHFKIAKNDCIELFGLL